MRVITKPLILHQPLAYKIVHKVRHRQSLVFMKKFSNVLVFLNVILVAVFIQTELTSKRLHASPDSHDAMSWAVASAISRDIYGLEGYVGYGAVLDHFWGNGYTARGRLGYATKKEQGFDRTFEDVVWNIDVNNQILNSSLSLNLPTGQENWGNGGIFATPANDLGYIDYFSLAFKLFGYQFQSLQLLYVLLFSLGALGFILLCRQQSELLIVSFTVIGSMFIITETILFTDIRNVLAHHNQRFLDTLAIFPALSIFLAPKTRSNMFDRGLLFSQFLLIMMAVHFRSSSVWVVFPFCFILALNFGSTYYPALALKGALAVSSKKILRRSIALFLILFAHGQILQTQASSIYSIGEAIPKHMFWHNIYMGLTLHPGWAERFGDRTNGKIGTDDAAWVAGMKRAADNGIDGMFSLNHTGNSFRHMDKRFHEIMIKDEFLDTVSKDKSFALSLYLYHKPLATISRLVEATISAFTEKVFLIILLYASLIAAAAKLRFRLRLDRKLMFSRLIVLGFFFTSSMVPVYLTYPFVALYGAALILFFSLIVLLVAIPFISVLKTQN